MYRMFEVPGKVGWVDGASSKYPFNFYTEVNWSFVQARFGCRVGGAVGRLRGNE